MAKPSISVVVAGVKLAITRPFELVDRIEGSRQLARRGPKHEFPDRKNDPNQSLHVRLGVENCLSCAEEMREIEDIVSRRLGEPHRHDGGQTLRQALWIIIRHVKPSILVETGVARGVSSAYQLAALEKNGNGELWSIDLPPVRSGWKVDVGSAIPEELKPRWHYIRGSSRRELPTLMRDLGRIDLFVHDGLHTDETMKFEFETVWPYLSQKGVVVADDAEASPAFDRFSTERTRDRIVFGEPNKGTAVGLLFASDSRSLDQPGD